MALWGPSLTVTAEQTAAYNFELGDEYVGYHAVSSQSSSAALEHFRVSPKQEDVARQGLFARFCIAGKVTSQGCARLQIHTR